ncbi:MAG: hypothetical protein H6Q67_895 [Firmicutes bacterium]|nr:hypothetical protein [Bacillota bacterium]
MNKIKLLYDVVNTMKEKEGLQGVLNVQVEKDQAVVVSCQNEFEKNFLTGQTKVKVALQMDGPENIRLSEHPWGSWHQDGKHHEFWQHKHPFHGCRSLKEKLAKLALVFSLLHSLQAEEREDKSIVMSLNSNELPENVKHELLNKFFQAGMHHQHGDNILREFCAADKKEAVITMTVNQKYEVQQIVCRVEGWNNDESQMQPHNLKATIELSLG